MDRVQMSKEKTTGWCAFQPMRLRWTERAIYGSLLLNMQIMVRQGFGGHFGREVLFHDGDIGEGWHPKEDNN
ncbi:hypothetical protein N7491_004460 [Penicillium cf. griseofulvum]|uniref:Uncharacterized protein n=1 Tax=Penicillium cf. griseofulvum TaxID=2972120 RepID=A0A9W9J0I6_9EURO|nr:hypothetical protein N7472_007149 [Penicillium cf. griseofulvum]KAJ5422918.1 hypothetical protein N7445_011026 [Penicillium cf. griseofulvum]KAJ5433865.1 hypothetical protein N7491_004460 [Penicillium cf. griseofulvum]